MTMFKLIPLILFYSIVICPAVEAVESEPLKDCGTIYKCFVPETCVSDTPAAPPDVVEAIKSTQVSKDCAATIRFHMYASNWMHVWIESLNAATSSIVFNHKSGDLTTFECKKENNVVTGKYTTTGTNGQEEGPIKIVETSEDKLLCKFEVHLGTDKKVVSVDGNTNSKVQIVVGTGTSDEKSEEKVFAINELKCDPSSFKFKNNEKIKQDEHYTEINYQPGKYWCEGQVIKRMEYEVEDINSYKPVTKLTCKNDEFSIVVEGYPNPFVVPRDTDINIRCVADAQYFCNYKVKTPNPSADGSAVEPLMTMPDKNAMKVGEIQCPPSHTLIEVKEARWKPIIDGKIKCANHDGRMQWTLNGTKERLLTKYGPEVRCVNKLNCHELNKIPASSIKKGTLVDRKPKCRDGGTMKDIPSMTVVTGVECDGQSGKYMYMTESGKKEVGNTTFICEYPTIENKRESEENKSEAITTGGIAVAGIVGASIIVFVIVVFAISYLQTRRHRVIKQKTKEKDLAEWNEYGVKKKENGMNRKKMQSDGSQKKNLLHASGQQGAVDLARHGQNIWKRKMIPDICTVVEAAKESDAIVISKKEGVNGQAIPTPKLAKHHEKMETLQLFIVQKLMSNNGVINLEHAAKDKEKKGKKNATKDK